MASGPSAGGEAPIIECLPTGALAANCYLFVCPQTRSALVLDPGAEAERILARLGALQARVRIIVHSHGHFDHISATEAVQAGLPAPVPLAAHPADGYLYTAAARARAAALGYAVPAPLSVPDMPLHDGEIIEVGAMRLRVIHTPGHTPGSISLVCGATCVFSGDTLFHHGIGRTDLEGGDEDAIYASITAQLYPLPAALPVLPGHGPATTIGAERQSNPFVRG